MKKLDLLEHLNHDAQLPNGHGGGAGQWWREVPDNGGGRCLTMVEGGACQWWREVPANGGGRCLPMVEGGA